MITAIVLSAGESRRFGSPKALAPVGKVNAIERVQQALIDAGIEDIIVVLGSHAEAIEPHVFKHKHVRIVHNKDYKLGQTSSVRAAVSVADQKTQGFLIWPVDCPFIQSDTIKGIVARFLREQPSILIPTLNNKRGHPPLFASSLKSNIIDIPNDQGINALLHTHPVSHVETADPGIVLSFNTPAELEAVNLKLKN